MYSLWAILRWYPLCRMSADGTALMRTLVLLLDNLVCDMEISMEIEINYLRKKK